MTTAPMRSVFRAIGIDTTDAIVIGVLTAAAFVVGIAVMIMTVDCPGDGPTHAISAYEWAQHPGIETHGWWLPGFDYIVGLAFMLLRRPLLTPRLCNLVLSNLTIPLFYALVKKVYGSPTALLSTIAFAAFPLRIGLGASSLTEAIFLFYAIGGLLFLMTSVENGHLNVIYLIVAVALLVLAEMTRYEIWALIPLLLGYLYMRSSNIKVTALAGAVLAVFPLEWSTADYFKYGSFLYALSNAEHPAEGGSPLDLASATISLARFVIGQIGWLLVAGAIVGVIAELYRAYYRKPGGPLLSDRAAYAVLTLALWSMIFKGIVDRGGATYDRYFFFGLTLALPLAAVGYLSVFGRYRFNLPLGIGAIAASLSTVYLGLYPLNTLYTPIYVSRYQPTDGRNRQMVAHEQLSQRCDRNDMAQLGAHLSAVVRSGVRHQESDRNPLDTG
jgi:Dolichyl-phosphate-mannose-protein mannosyltransferase